MSQPVQGGPAAGAGDQGGGSRPQSKRLQQTQAQVDEMLCKKAHRNSKKALLR